MLITIDTVLSGFLTVDAPTPCTTQQLKSLIQQKHGYDAQLQTLVQSGKILSDQSSIPAAATSQQQSIFLVLLMRMNDNKDQYMTTQQIEMQKRIREEIKRQQQLAAEKQIQAEKDRLVRQQEELVQQRQQQERQEQMRRQMEQIPLPTVDELPVDDNLMAMLIEMGFSEFASKKALLLCRMNVNTAAEYLFSHAGDPSIEAPLTRPQMVAVLQANPQFQHHWQRIQQQLQQAGLLTGVPAQQQQFQPPNSQ